MAESRRLNGFRVNTFMDPADASSSSLSWTERLDRLRAEWNAYTGSQGTRFSFEFAEQQVLDLASGYVPLDIRAAFMAALDWREDDRRRANRPSARAEIHEPDPRD